MRANEQTKQATNKRWDPFANNDFTCERLEDHNETRGAIGEKLRIWDTNDKGLYNLRKTLNLSTQRTFFLKMKWLITIVVVVVVMMGVTSTIEAEFDETDVATNWVPFQCLLRMVCRREAARSSTFPTEEKCGYPTGSIWCFRFPASGSREKRRTHSFLSPVSRVSFSRPG